MESLLPSVKRGMLTQFRRTNAFRYARIFEDRRRATRVMIDYRDHLDGRMREIFDMTYNQGLSQDEIAHALNLDRRTVGRYLERARGVIYRLAMGRPGDARRSRN